MSSQADIIRATIWNKTHPLQRRIHRNNRNWKSRGVINKDGTFFTYTDYDRHYQLQQGKCAGCGIHQSDLKNSFHVDHDHKTGIFRFLLCMNCNRALGHAQDNPIILRKLADLMEAK